MHKNLSFLALPLVLPLIAGCGGSDLNVDKVNLKDTLTQPEAGVVLFQAMNNLKKFSKITEKSLEYENDDGLETTNEYSGSTVAYKENAIYASGSYKEKWSDPSGLNYEKSTNGFSVDTIMTENDIRYPVTYYETKEDTYFQVGDKLAAEAKPTLYEDTVQNYVADIEDALVGYGDYFFVYKNGKSYKAVQSWYSENVSPVYYGNDTAIRHTVKFQRLTWEINDKYQITSYKSLYVEQDNLDPATGEFLEKVEEILRNEYEFKFEYKDRASKDKKVTEVEEKFKGNRFVNASLRIELVDENKNPYDWAYPSYSDLNVKYLGLNKVQIDLAFSCGGMDFRGIGLQASIYFTDKLDPSAEKTKVDKVIPFSGEGITVDGNYGMYQEVHEVINVVFSATAEIVNGDVVVTPTIALQLS